jgi:hypothetical protein
MLFSADKECVQCSFNSRLSLLPGGYEQRQAIGSACKTAAVADGNVCD